MKKYNHVVLCSGGIESSFCLMHAIKSCINFIPVFFDYGQPYFAQEFETVSQTISNYCTNHRCPVPQIIDISKLKIHFNGYFENRNEIFIQSAVDMFKVKNLFLGIRGIFPYFDSFGDTNIFWKIRMERKYGIKILTPCLLLPKFYQTWKIKRNGLNPKLLFSSENYKGDINV